MPQFTPQHLIPALSVAVLALLSALPWGLPPEARFFLPLLPYAAIHFWVIRRPGLMPEWLVFLTGLTTDVLTHGPLGFWSLTYLLGYIFARVLPQTLAEATLLRWGHFCMTLCGMALAQWAIASIYFLSWADWKPLAGGMVAAGLAYPVIGLMFRPLSRLWIRPDNGFLARGE